MALETGDIQGTAVRGQPLQSEITVTSEAAEQDPDWV